MAKRKISVKKISLIILIIILVLSVFDKIGIGKNDKLILNEDKNERYKIFIDTGHGGKDVGTVSINGSYEKDIAFEISTQVINELSKYSNVDLITSRIEDRYISLKDRVNHANDVDADYFISIHLNADPNTSKTNGIETYYSESDKKETKKSYEFSEYIQKQLIESTGAKDRGVKKSNFMVTKFTKMPAVLIECGFLSNKNEQDKLITKTYQKKLAEGIVNGLVSYIEKID